MGGDAAGSKHAGAGVVGMCSRERFKQLLKGLWRTHFTDEQVDQLATLYAPARSPDCPKDDGTIDLSTFSRRLCRRVLESRKCAAASGQTGTRPGGGGTISSNRMTAQETKDLTDIIADIRGRIRRERINLKPAFQSFDARNELVVASEQFARVLSAQGLLPPSPRSRQLLTRRYGVSDFRRQTTVHQGFVAYLEFLEDVDAPAEMETQAYIDNFVFGRDQQAIPSKQQHVNRTGDVQGTSTAAELRSAASHTSDALMGRGGIGANPVRSCDAVLRDVRRKTARERVRMLDLFADFDRLGHGTCTQAQLARVMKTLDHALTDGELAAVCRRYESKVSGQCSSGDGTPLVVYKRLVADIESVFTVNDLDKKSATTKVWQAVRDARGTEARLRGKSSRVEELTAEEERLLAKFLRELAMKVNKESLSLSTLFTDYDKLNVGVITETGMERALGGACLLPPEHSFRAIVKKFREHSRRSSGGEVNYRAFLAAVELAQDPLRTPRDIPNATKFRAMRAEGAPDALASAPSPQEHGADGVITPRTQRSALESALVSVGKQLVRTHCQLEDFLAEEDRLNTGEVSRTALRHCLVLAGVQLTTSELEAVDKSFRSVSRPETVAWQDFCKASISAARGRQREMDSTTKDVDGGGGRPLSFEEGDLLMKIEGEIKARNPNLEALFKDFDKSNHGTVTEAQFFSLLNQGLPRMHLTYADTDMLANMFVDRTGCDFGGRVKYMKFIDAVGT